MMTVACVDLTRSLGHAQASPFAAEALLVHGLCMSPSATVCDQHCFLHCGVLNPLDEGSLSAGFLE